MEKEIVIEAGGQHWLLLPQKAMLWLERNILIVSDLHLGKAAAFQKNGILVPEGSMRSDLSKLKTMITAHGAIKCLVVGDFIHAAAGLSTQTVDMVSEWLAHIECPCELIWATMI